jgi:quercetin dioxygenase-like cupin family protein
MSSDQFPKERVCALDKSIEYAEQAIVSKPVVKTPGGNISLFAFDVGQELSEHTAPFDALVQVIDGMAEIRINKNVHKLNAGESIIMPANEPHAVKAIQRFKMLLTMIRTS